MQSDKRHRYYFFLLALTGGLFASFARAGDGPAPPHLSENHRRFLSKLARRTIEDAVHGRRAYQPSYVPAELGDTEAEVVVRVWQDGYLLASGLGEREGVAEASRKAAVSAGTVLAGEHEGVAEQLDDLLIEMEAAGPPQALPHLGDWTKVPLTGQLEPGVQGLILLGAGGNRRIYPSELIRTDLPVSDALQELAKFMRMSPTEITNTPLQRFCAAHWYQDGPAGAVVSLQRGLVLEKSVEAPRDFDGRISTIAEYMMYRQLPSGLFSYQFNPGADRYSDEDNAVLQASATAAMAAYARHSGKGAASSAADMAIRVHLQGMRPFEGQEDAAFIATADGANELGATALLCIALAEHPDAAGFADTRGRLLRGILGLQRPSGMFLTAFPPAVKINEQDYFPGEALLALAMEYERAPAPELLEAFDKAIVFYRDYSRSRRSPALVAWQVQAFSLMARQTKRQDFADFTFELADWLADYQLTDANCPWPELHGAIDVGEKGKVGISTASYLEAFSEALLLARHLQDGTRASRYETVVRRGARFVAQLQVRPEEAYSMRSPQDAVGGLRAAPALNRLRIDYSAQALRALIKARRALFFTEG